MGSSVLWGLFQCNGMDTRARECGSKAQRIGRDGRSGRRSIWEEVWSDFEPGEVDLYGWLSNPSPTSLSFFGSSHKTCSRPRHHGRTAGTRRPRRERRRWRRVGPSWRQPACCIRRRRRRGTWGCLANRRPPWSSPPNVLRGRPFARPWGCTRSRGHHPITRDQRTRFPHWPSNMRRLLCPLCNSSTSRTSNSKCNHNSSSNSHTTSISNSQRAPPHPHNTCRTGSRPRRTTRKIPTATPAPPQTRAAKRLTRARCHGPRTNPTVHRQPSSRRGPPPPAACRPRPRVRSGWWTTATARRGTCA